MAKKTDLAAVNNDGLSAHDQFARDIKVVRNGMKSFTDVVRALSRIKDDETWRDGGYNSYSAFIDAEIPGSRCRIIQLTQAVEVMDGLPANLREETGVNLKPAHLKVLRNVPEEKRADVVRQAAERAPDNDNEERVVTAGDLEDTYSDMVTTAAEAADTDRIALATAGLPMFEQALQSIKQIKKGVKDMVEEEAGKSVNLTAVNALLANLASEIKAAKPHCKCVYCQRGCEACGDTGTRGWNTLQTFKGAPKDLQAKAELL